MLADGELTAPELLEIYLERIARLDSQLRSFRVVLADKARDEACAAQDRLDAGERLPLLGVPIAIKDDVDVAGEVTTCGSGGHRPAATVDAVVVRRLRAAGAIIIGKTATPELMMFPFTESLTFGATRNPWNPGRTPGQQRWQRRRGGGRVGVVGAGFRRRRLDPHPVDLVWPVRHQAAARPGLAGAARRGLVRAERQRPDRAQCAGRGAVPGRHEHGARTRGRVRGGRHPRAGQAANCVEHQGPNAARQGGAAQLAAVEEAGGLLRELGHDVVVRDPAYPLAPIFANFLPRYLRGISDDADAQAHPERLERRTRSMARMGSFFSDRRMAAVRAAEARVSGRVGSIFDDVDVVLTPGTARGPSRIGAYQHRGGLSTLLLVGQRVPYFPVWNVTGQPAAVVPWGFDDDGLPLSVQLVGRPFDEATLLSLSAQIEAARPWAHHRPPLS